MIKPSMSRVFRSFERLIHGAPQPSAPTVSDGFRSIDAIDTDDIVIVGYPKSGNTWCQYLISGLVYGVSPMLAPDSLVQDLVPDVHVRKLFRRYGTPMFFKSHFLPRPEYRRVIYLLRDGRDAMVSYLHFLNASAKERQFSLKDLVLTGEGLFPCRWHEHVDRWQENPHSAEILTLKYEDLRHDTVHELQRICEFAKISRESEHLRLVAESANFENMRQRERRLGWEDPNWPKDKPFVRRGVVGSYQDEFPKDLLEVFVSQSRATLLRTGYACS